MSLHVPAGTTLVTGFKAEHAATMPIELDLPADFVGGEHTIQVAGEPVKITFTRLPG